MLVFDPETEGKNVTIEEIPEEHQDWRTSGGARCSKSSTTTATRSDGLALQEEPIPVDLIRKTAPQRHAPPADSAGALRFGSARHRRAAGARRVQYYLPSPAEVRRSRARTPTKRSSPKWRTRKPDPDEPFCGLVFKVLPAKTGDIHWVRVYSGELKANSRMLNPAKDKKENVAQLWHIHATKQEGQVSRGGRRHCRRDRPAALDHRRHALRPEAPDPAGIDQFPETVISMAIEPESDRRAEKAGRHARHAQAAGSHAPREAAKKRGRRSSAAWASCTWKLSKPPAARLQAQCEVSQAAGQLPRNDRAGGRGHGRMQSRGRGTQLYARSLSHGAVRGRLAAGGRAEQASRPEALPENFDAAWRWRRLTPAAQGGGEITASR
jgi:hypothetical protein